MYVSGGSHLTIVTINRGTSSYQTSRCPNRNRNDHFLRHSRRNVIQYNKSDYPTECLITSITNTGPISHVVGYHCRWSDGDSQSCIRNTVA